MRKSSFIIASLAALALSLAILLPNSSVRSAVTDAAPQLAVHIPESDSAAAATSSPVTAVVLPVPTRAPVRPFVAAPEPVVVSSAPVPAIPTGLAIPSIELNSRVIPVSTNEKGEMNVPSGSTSDVGWYAQGIIPGDIGAAVMDAHVFAGFSRLHALKQGDDIYVTDANGAHLHFVVTATKLYALSDLTSGMLFQETVAGRHLNLITCAGSLTPDHSTYDHRLIVYAELAN